MKILHSSRSWLGLRSIAAAVVVAGLLLCSAGTVLAQTTLTFTGAVQTYTVPPGAVGITIQARGAGGGGAGSDGQPNTDGGAGGAGAQASGTYSVTAGTSLNVFVGGAGGSAQSNEGGTGNSCASTAGSAGVASGGYAGGAGSTAGCSPYSGGGGGGGAASGVALGATPILIAGGGSGGQGGSLGGNGVGGLASSATGAIASPSAGQNGSAPGWVGGGGGGGGGGCPGGVGGLFKPDNDLPNTATAAGAGSSCRAASVTGFSVIGGGGGAGGTGAVAFNWFREVASGARPGASGQVVITPIYQVAVVKTGPAVLVLDTPSAYTLTVTNTGVVPATTARVLDQLPVDMTYNSASGTGWTCAAAAPNANGTLVTCNFSGSIAFGGTSVLTINATPTTSTTKINRASIDRSGGASPPSALGCSGADTPSLGCAAPVTSNLVGLNISKGQPAPALAVGSNSSYTITVTNNGTEPALIGAGFLDQLPANLTFVSATGTGFNCPTAAGGSSVLVTCNTTTTLAAGASRTVALVVTLTNNLQVTNFIAVDPRGGTTVPNPSTCTAANTPARGCGAPVVTTPNTNLSTVSGQVYLDANANSTLDGAESGTGITGLFVKLRASSGTVCSGNSTRSAAVDPVTGAFNLTSVPVGNYCLYLDNNSTANDVVPFLPTGFVGTQNASGIIQVSVTTAPELAQNFGLFNGSQLSGVVFLDNGVGLTANNGLQEGAEAGFGGIVVEARNGALALIASATTAANGSYTMLIPAGTGSLTVTPALPSGYLATGGSPGTTGGSYSRPSVTYLTANGTTRTGVNFGTIPPNSFIANGGQTTAPGTVVFYTHTYTTGSEGNVIFTLSALANPSIAGWTQVLYRDTNCSAVFDPAEPQITGAVAATVGTAICLIVRQQVPPGAPVGAQNTISVTATMDYANDSPVLTPPVLTVTDTTTVGAGSGVVLAKLVRNITVNGPGVGTTAVNAAPGATLEYTITATNNGSQPVSTIVINDATPTFTNFLSAACPGSLPPGITACTVSSAPAVGGTGAVTTTLTGSLTPTAQVSVAFRVKVDQ